MPLWQALSVRMPTATTYLVSAILLLPLALSPGAVWAGGSNPDESRQSETQSDEQNEREKDVVILPQEATEAKKDDDDEMMIDSLQQGVQSSVDATARWIDNFFGDGRTFDDQYRSQGRFSLSPEWSEFNGFRMGSSFRAQVNLPLAEERFAAFVGRVDTDDYVVGDDTERRASVLRNVSGDSEWLIGLGFNPGQGEENRFSVSAGVRGGLRADFYTEGRYLYQLRLTDSAQIRTRSALFWRASDGYGFAQRLDYEQTWRDDWLGRFSLEGTSAERIEGIRWRGTTSVYYLYNPNRAVATEVWYRGESKAPVPDEDVGVRFIHRQSWLRDWFYVEKWFGSHWPKDDPAQNRSQAWLLGIEFEVWFGY